jgi:cation transport regulator ChaB
MRMPYSSVSQLPKYVKKYSPKVKRQWMHVFNTVFKKTKSEARAFKAANSVLRKRFKGQDSMSKNTRNDYFNMLVDSYLGNLKG